MPMSVKQAYAALTAPGAPFEMEERLIRGEPIRVWKHAPPSLRAVLDQTLLHGDLPFLVYEDERISYREHYRAVARLARLLGERYGIAKGDRVAIAMRNYPEWPLAFFAAAVLGAVVVPLNAWMTGTELEYCLSDSGSSLLFADQERLERLAPHLPGLGLRGSLIARASGSLPPNAAALEAALADSPAEADLPDVALEPEDNATIFYTSGTTGRPKGALGTHRNICTILPSVAFTQARVKLRRGEALPGPAEVLPKKAYLLSVPFFHVTGCHAVLVANAWGGHKVVIMHKWDPERAMALIERERVTSFGGVPSMPWQVIESPSFGRYDLSSLETVSYGGAPAAPELVARIRQVFPGARAGNGYGLTETSSVVTQNLGEDYERKPDSAGPAVPVCDLKVVGADGRELPVGEVGELWVRGPNVVPGYWNKPEATAASFGGGWFRTGDLVRLDEEGFVYILDRAKDMLIRGGENIYCVEVEDALYSHPAVMDAAVVGIPHRVLGEEVGAVVQLKPGMQASSEALKSHVGARLAAFKVPVRIVLLDEPLPRNANGKILKQELRRMLQPG